MKIFCIAVLFLLACEVPGAQPSFAYHDAKEFTFIGHGFSDTSVYQRLPNRFKDKVRPELWQISLVPAGISICFFSNSPGITVKWKTGNQEHYPHVAGSLVKGIDLYARENGTWYFAGLGNPRKNEYNEAVLIRGMDTSIKEFRLNLPMYETVDSVYIGVTTGSVIRSPGKKTFSIPEPIVFYGTSIVQGASAMRPGMAYPSIISRHLDVETVNLGFSGNGLLETELGEAMAEIAASCYVIDCGPNLTPALAKLRTVPFIKLLQQKQPGIPILLIENIRYPEGRFDHTTKETIDSVNLAFKQAYDTMKKQGNKNLYYLPADDLIGSDGEATVDGTHLTDLGFMRIAAQIEKQLKIILKLK